MIIENRPSLFLVRHAESMQNVKQNLDRDSSLSELGIKQATEVGASLKLSLSQEKPAVIVHTGLSRAFDTAKLIKQFGELKAPLIEMPQFREREMGIYNKMDFAELIKRNPHMEPFYQQYRGSCVWFFDGQVGEGVEPLQEMKIRINQGLENLYMQYIDMPVVIVGHAGSVKMIRFLYEEDPDINLAKYLSSYVPKNCEVYRLKR